MMPKNMEGVMHEFKSGALHSGAKTGPVVKNPKQAVAIGLNEQRAQGKTVPPPSGSMKALHKATHSY